MSPERIAAALLMLAVLIAWVRLWRWHRNATIRRRAWRIVALAALQPVLAGALFLTVFPPPRIAATRELVIATAGAPRLVATGANETLIALPEAGNIVGAIREPDLGTALRHRPGTPAIRVVGNGLAARDRPAARSITVRYAAPPSPRGLIALVPPASTAPGDRFAVTARIIGDTAVSLLDPAGRIVDTAKPVADGSITLYGTARGPGEVLFTLRLHDGSTTQVPLATEAARPIRALILAAAPGPEVKFLRRWAADAGLTSQAQLAVGGGLTLGEAPASYTGYDLVIIDDRSWTTLGNGARAALTQAVRGGMGLVLRLTGPVPRGWQLLGLGLSGGGDITPLRLPPAAPTDAALAARRGIGTRDAPASAAAPLGEMPDLTRLATTMTGVPLLRDVRGTPYAAWRNVGRGRVAVVSLLDSFALVTSGNGDAHADIWSTLAATIARGVLADQIRIDPLPYVGERIAICGAGTAVTTPDAGTIPLTPDPAAGGCAGFWPQISGWHRVGAQPFYVYPADALPTVRTAERRAATLALVGTRARSLIAAPSQPAEPSWRWFLLFLSVATLTWWLERRRR